MDDVIYMLKNFCTICRLQKETEFNRFASSPQQSTKSLIYIINKTGCKIDPCGIPLRTSLQQDVTPFTITRCFLSARKAFIQRIILGFCYSYGGPYK